MSKLDESDVWLAIALARGEPPLQAGFIVRRVLDLRRDAARVRGLLVHNANGSLPEDKARRYIGRAIARMNGLLAEHFGGWFVAVHNDNGVDPGVWIRRVREKRNVDAVLLHADQRTVGAPFEEGWPL
jgi:hypothetical protein